MVIFRASHCRCGPLPMTTESQLQALAVKHGFQPKRRRTPLSRSPFGQRLDGSVFSSGIRGFRTMDARRDDHDRRHVQQFAQGAGRFPLLRPPVRSTAGARGRNQRRRPAFGFGHQPSWWPEEYGSPSSTGGQNDFQYAYFPSRQRLVVNQQNTLHVFDTTGHFIGGFSQQQQPGIQGFCFSSQQGTFFVTNLRPIPAGS
jgi:hypothetical protein